MPCPSCKAQIEIYDAPSSLIWGCTCYKCGWNDGLSYFEDKKGIIYKISEKEAREKGIIENCPGCSNYMTLYEKERWNQCYECEFRPGALNSEATKIKKKK